MPTKFLLCFLSQEIDIKGILGKQYLVFAFLFVIFSNGKAKSLFISWKLESIK